jgi:hypothetical protein
MNATSSFHRFVVLLTLTLAGCNSADDNSKPIYGQQTGLPANCRAYVQHSIDSYRDKRFTGDETMAGLERNCGKDGALWKN